MPGLKVGITEVLFQGAELPPTMGATDLVAPREVFRTDDGRLARQLIQSAIQKANDMIYRTAQRQAQCKGMGTTLVAALFRDDRVTVAHVGDCRLYRLRDDAFKQITVDHSLQQELINKGFYTPEEAREAVSKNIVTRAIGVEPTVDADLAEELIREGDVYLLCSDGLSDLLEDAEIQFILQQFNPDLEAAAEALVKSANDKGGKDNISVVLARPAARTESEQMIGECPAVSATMQIVSRSDVGRKRSHNEDNVRTDSAIGIAVLADGMSGYNAGEVASAIAVNLIADELQKGLQRLAANGADEAVLEEEASAVVDNTSFDGEYLQGLLGERAIEVEEITIGDVEAAHDAPAVIDHHTEMARNLEIGS